jgi:hypothetical protein
MTENKSKDVNINVGKARVSNFFYDAYVAHKISTLTECNMRNASHLKEPWLINFILSSAFVATVAEPDKAYFFNFLRRVEGAFIEYKLAREALKEFIEARKHKPEENRISPYFRALLHFEIFIAQLFQAYEFLRTKSGMNFFTKGSGTIIEKFHKLYNSSKHMDKWIAKGRIPPKATVVIWITNKGLESKDEESNDIRLSFDEMYEALKETAKFAQRISNLGVNQKDN